MECPCKKCPKKGCGTYHDKCTDYADWRKWWEELSKVNKRRDEALRLFFDDITKCKKRK